MSNADSQIDELYQEPLESFVAARGALAKTLTGPDAARVRKLPKPTRIPWAVNQVYWKARRAYDRLLASGKRLRQAQIAALEGRSADVRAATDAHRQAIAEAVQQAERLAAGSPPAPDALTRTFEALSLAGEPPEPHGRLTKPLRPLGFEALTGVNPKPSARAVNKSKPPVGGALQGVPSQRPRALAAAARQRQRALKKAEAALKRAEAVETKARRHWERRKHEVERARTAVSNLQSHNQSAI